MSMNMTVDGYDKEEENTLRLHPLASISSDIHTKPHFFKIIIIPPHLHKLRIPPAFTNKFRDDLLESAYLSAPYGETFKVDLIKDDKNVWFHDGWNAFANHYSLECGHFLVFRYEGNSRFRVFIFDVTATEIDYPDTICIMNESDGELESGKDEAVAFHRAMEFNCGNPVFVIRMCKTYVTASSSYYNRLSIPSSFVREYMMEKPKALSLRTAASHESWTVECYYCKGQPARLTVGWLKFASDNDLKEGDACVFELIKGSKHYRVHIFRA